MKILTTICTVCITFVLYAEELQFEGIIGNSGSLDNPVLFNEVNRNTRGLGTVYDPEAGILYDRAGSATLIAYALDGRMLSRYKLPEGSSHQDTMTLCNRNIVLLLNNRIYTLPLDAPDESEAAPASTEIKEPVGLSSSSRDGSVAVLCKDGNILLFNPANGKTESFAQAPDVHCTGMDWGADGDLYLIQGKTAYRFHNGIEIKDDHWPLRFAGERESGIDSPIRLDNFWYGSAWHGTIKRFTLDFKPAPGVILGGASGHFIGHVAGNYDVELSQGMTHIKDGLFAIGGLYGIIHLAEWDEKGNRMTLRRRIGSLTDPGGLTLNSQGDILCSKNIWEWKSDSLSPATISHVYRAVAQCSHFDSDNIIGIAEIYGKPGIISGTFSEEQLYGNRLENLEVPGDIIGTALYRKGKGNWNLLILGADGSACVHQVAQDNRNPWRKFSGRTVLQTVDPVRKWTSVAMLDDDTMIAAGDGKLITFTRDGDTWKESSRWTDSFGEEIFLSVDSGRIAVSDTRNNRILLYSADSRRKIAETRSQAPRHIAINGGFIAVYESTAQRIVKYTSTPGVSPQIKLLAVAQLL